MSHSEILCKYVEHKQKEISMICVNEKCDKVRPGCLDCLKQFHKQHLDDMLDLSEFNIWRIQNIKIIEEVKSIIQEMEIVTQMLKQFLKKNLIEPNYNQSTQTIEQINNQVKQVIQLKQNGQIIHEDVNRLSQGLQQLKIKFQEAKLNPIYQLQEISIKQVIQEEKHHQLYLFSQQSKNQFVTISKQGQIAQGAGFCMVETSIPDNGVNRFIFKIINKGVGLAIGICIKNIVSKVNYVPDISKKGHGCYLISDSGYSYSHHQQEMNKAFKSFKFFDDEIIIVQVDTINKKIIWTQKQSDKKFSLELEHQEQFYPCIDLDYDGKVEIMNYEFND